MTLPAPLSEHAQAVYDVLLATARRDAAGRVVSTQTLYRFLEERFALYDPVSRRVRTRAVRELTDHGLVLRDNVRGRAVELLWVGDATSTDADPTFDDYTAAIEHDLDVATEATRRVEQRFLRRVLLRQQSEGTCGFCGRLLPADLLVAAHLQRRAELSRTEKLNFQAVAVLACTLGCDSLYELGYLGVDEHGLMVTADPPNSAVAAHLYTLNRRPCPGYNPARAPYLQQHRASRFRGAPTTRQSADAALQPGQQDRRTAQGHEGP